MSVGWSNLFLRTGLLPEGAHQVVHDPKDETLVVMGQDRPDLTVVEPRALAVLTHFELDAVELPVLEMPATLRASHVMQATLGIPGAGVLLLASALNALGVELGEIFDFVLAGLALVGHCLRCRLRFFANS